MNIFENLESTVRSYSRSFPVVFEKAQGAQLYDNEGNVYLDFLSGAGSLNYGHNPEKMKQKAIEYLENDGLVHGLDMASVAKKEFLETFQELILFPREMDYKIQFSGPTGTNAVEAALKIARKVTGRSNIISFTNGFHGVTMGSVAATANSHYRDGAGVSLTNTQFMPYDGYLGDSTDTIGYIRKFLEDSSSGVDLPAAFIVETVQGEGGVNVASFKWLRKLEALCREFDILLIVDDIQVGCGRTGKFFSFEDASISPDIVVLSKSLSGFGLPFSIVLMKPEFDQWKPGEHNGTFRGNNLAFVTATETLKSYWGKESLTPSVLSKSRLLEKWLDEIVENYSPELFTAYGRGLIRALKCHKPGLAAKIREKAFEKGVIIETCGSEDEVLKFLPPLIISEEDLREGVKRIAESIEEVLFEKSSEKPELMAVGER